MTTIAYDHENKTIAVDSRMTLQGVISSDDKDKVIYKGAVAWVLCGSICDLDDFTSLTKGQRFESELTIDASGIRAVDSKAYHVFMHEGVFCEELLTCNLTLGSGSKFATASMDYGSSAKEAVEYAMTRDIYTGGKVKEIKL